MASQHFESGNLFKIFEAGPENFERVSYPFHCPTCRQRVAKAFVYIRQALDHVCFVRCECGVLTFWELENRGPRNVKEWCRICRLFQRYGVDVVSISPGREGTPNDRN